MINILPHFVNKVVANRNFLKKLILEIGKYESHTARKLTPFEQLIANFDKVSERNITSFCDYFNQI